MTNNKHRRNQQYMLGQFYISPKYTNLKHELSNNSICCISLLQWDNVLEKARQHITTSLYKAAICKIPEPEIYYQIAYESCMTISHIVAVMVYCNQDVLQRKFSATYRRMSAESVHKMIDRHRNFAHLGRLLRECVECFGKKHSSAYNIKVYRGINKCFTFESLYAYIKAPFSTTTSYQVAVQFCNNKGVILGIEIDASSWMFRMNEGAEAFGRLNCFDCSWISDFQAEQEIFCIGGMNKFYFDTIIDVPHDKDHKPFINALNQMTSSMSQAGIAGDTFATNIPAEKSIKQWLRQQKLAECMKKNKKFAKTFHDTFKTTTDLLKNTVKFDDIINNKSFKLSTFWKSIFQKEILLLATTKEFEEKIVYRLYQHQIYKFFPNNKRAYKWSSISPYFETIMDAHCKSIKFIPFVDKKHRVFDAFFKYDWGWCKLKEITTLFPNTIHIQFQAIHKPLEFIQNDSIYGSILSFARNWRTIKYIMGCQYLAQSIETTKELVAQIITSYKHDLERYQTVSELQETLMEQKLRIMKQIMNAQYLVECDACLAQLIARIIVSYSTAASEKSNQFSRLNHITLSIPPKFYEKMKTFISGYKEKFQKEGWKIDVQKIDPIEKFGLENYLIDIKQHPMRWLKQFGLTDKYYDLKNSGLKDKDALNKVLTDFTDAMGLSDKFKALAAGAKKKNDEPFNLLEDYKLLKQVLVEMRTFDSLRHGGFSPTIL
eukprot:210024_1